MYSFRRTAIAETRRNEDDSMAGQLAYHQDYTSLDYYDDQGLADLDVSAMRLGLDRMSRNDLRAALSQARVSRIMVSDPATNLHQILMDKSKASAYADLEWVLLETNMASFLRSVTDKLEGEPIPVMQGYIERIRNLLRAKGQKDLLDQLYLSNVGRRQLFRRLRAREKILTEHKRSRNAVETVRSPEEPAPLSDQTASDVVNPTTWSGQDESAGALVELNACECVFTDVWTLVPRLMYFRIW